MMATNRISAVLFVVTLLGALRRRSSVGFGKAAPAALGVIVLTIGTLLLGGAQPLQAQEGSAAPRQGGRESIEIVGLDAPLLVNGGHPFIVRASNLSPDLRYQITIRVSFSGTGIVGFRSDSNGPGAKEGPPPAESRAQPSDCSNWITGISAPSRSQSHDWNLTLNACMTGEAALTANLRLVNGGSIQNISTAGHIVTVVDAPGPVGELGLTEGDRHLTVDWVAPELDGGSPITGYEVRHKRTDAESPSWVSLVGPVTTEEATVSDLINGMSYDVQVRACSAVGCGDWSEEMGVPNTPPGRVAIPVLTEDDASLQVSWSAPLNLGTAVTGYDVRYIPSDAIDKADANWTVMPGAWTSGERRYAITGLTNGEEYDVQVRACNDDPDCGAWSPTVTGKPYTTPGPVGELTFGPGVRNVQVSWGEPYDGGSTITGYDVRYRAGGSGSFTDADFSGPDRNATITGLNPHTEYEVQVRAENRAGPAPWSSPSAVATENSAPVFDDGGPTSRMGPENAAAGEDIGAAVSATDEDGDPLTYTLGVTDAASFDIVGSSGQLRTKAPLDYEVQSSYSLVVTVSDEYGGSASITTAIAVTNVDEAGTVGLSSDQPQVGAELTATLADPDGSVSGVAWSWESSSDQTNWASISGTTTASYTPVAGDVGSYLRATAAYADGHGPGKSAQTALANAVQAPPAGPTVAIDFDPSGPVLPGSPIAVTMSFSGLTFSNAAGLTFRADVVDQNGNEAAACEGGGIGVDRYMNVVDADPEVHTGTIAGACPQGDYTLAASISTSADVELASASADFSVATNRQPQFLAVETGVRSVAENTAAGGSIGAPVSAADPDTGDTLTYTLGGADAAFFDIDMSTGQLSVADGVALDFEDPVDADANNVYAVTVSVSDGKDADGNAEAAADDTVGVAITVADQVAPAAPSAPTVSPAPTDSHSSLDVSWTAPADTGPAITDYDVQYRADGSGDFADARFFGAGTSARIEGLSSSTLYEVQVRAVNDEGVGAWSASGRGTTDAPTEPPAQPTGFTAAAGNTQVWLNWDDPEDATITKWQYGIGEGAGPEEWRDVPESTAITTAYRVTGLNNGSQYRFRVRAVNSAGSGPGSGPLVVTLTPYPARPTGLAATPGDGRVTLRWDGPGDPAITKRQYNQQTGGTWGAWRDIPNSAPGEANATSYTVEELTNGVEYAFAIRAVNDNGNSPPSRAVAAIPTPYPARPTGFTATAGAGQVTLSWDGAGAAAITKYQYNVRCGGSWGAWTDIPGSGAGTTSYTVAGLASGTECAFTIRAVNAHGNSAPADADSATPTGA